MRIGLFGAALVLTLSAPTIAAAGPISENEAHAILATLAGTCVALAAWLMLRRQRETSLALAALDDEVQRLAVVLDHCPDPWLLCQGDRIVRSDPRLLAWFGLSGLDTLSQLGTALDAESFATLERAATRLRDNGREFAVVVAAGGGTVHLAARGIAVAGTAFAPRRGVIWLRDITAERNEAEHLAAEAEMAALGRDSLMEVLDVIPVPVWRRASDLAIVWCNRAYAEAVERERVDALATAGIELAPASAADDARALAARALTTGLPQRKGRTAVIRGERRTLEVIEIPHSSRMGTIGVALDVTALSEVRAEFDRFITEQEDVLESLATPIAVFGADKRLKFFNSALARLWRVEDAWLATRPSHSEVLQVLRERRRLPEQADFPAYQKSLFDLYTSLIEPLEDVHHLPDGTTLRVRISAHPLGGLLFMFDDITDRLDLERARNTLMAVQEATLNNLHEAVAVFGQDGRLKLHNANFREIWKQSPEQLRNHPHVGEIIDSIPDRVLWSDDWAAVRKRIISLVTERRSRAGRMERADGRVIDYSATPLPDGNLLYTYLDVTDSVRIERALRERNEALEMADRLKTEFLANVSYELRTPLNTVIGFADILANAFFGPLNARQLEYTRGILHSSYHLLDLINDIIDLATIEAGRMSLDLGILDLHRLLDGMLPLIREAASMRDLRLEVACPSDIGTIEADERRLKQVVYNLLSNAIKFTPDGGCVQLSARREGDDFLVSVLDTGPGILPEEQHRVFENFLKGTGQSAETPGAGLGLSLVKHFVELHGGQVELRSEPGAGTCVTCRLPARAGARPNQRAAA